jgi:hypothetical protein
MLSPPCAKRRERRLEKGTAFYSIVYASLRVTACLCLTSARKRRQYAERNRPGTIKTIPRQCGNSQTIYFERRASIVYKASV